jgi:hypothetical protein
VTLRRVARIFTAPVLLIAFASVLEPKALAQETISPYQACKNQLEGNFEGAYSAGKFAAVALSLKYSKMNKEGKEAMRKIFFRSKNDMADLGVANISLAGKVDGDRVACYMGGHKKLNPGFIAGFSENLTPNLKKIYFELPLMR